MDSDERFKHIKTDPKFRRIPKSSRKVKIDNRFKSMFNDEKFKLKYKFDKRGRKINFNSSENLRRYYDLSSEESDSENESKQTLNTDNKTKKNLSTGKQLNKASTKTEKCINTKNKLSKKVEDEEGKDLSSTSDESEAYKDKENETESEKDESIKSKLKDLTIDYARGEKNLTSSSSDDESSSEEDFPDITHDWGELDKDCEETTETTNRLAVCNQNWEKIRAVDLFMLFQSFGNITSVVIYTSDFGLQRMKEEEAEGPKIDCNHEEFDPELLRKYELERLKYYYAIVVCGSVKTAEKIYDECDKIEFESSATKIDLRFVPNDLTFDNPIKDSCYQVPEFYEPRFFTTEALKSAKVELTWDETDLNRIEVLQKMQKGNLDVLNEDALKNYLANSDSESNSDVEADKYKKLLEEIENQQQQQKKIDVEFEEIIPKIENEDTTENTNLNSSASEDERNEIKQEIKSESEEEIEKYKQLVQHLEEKEKQKEDDDIEMEMTWNVNEKENVTKLIQKKMSEKSEQTPFQQFLNKRKEKLKKKREMRKRKNKEQDDEEDEEEEDQIKKSKTIKDDDKKEELELLLLNDQTSDKSHFSLKKIQKSSDDFEIDINDDRFSALFTSHHFNIDPSDANFKKTKAMERLIQEKLKRRQQEENDSNSSKNRDKSKNPELSVLLKSVKQKTKNFVEKK